MSCRNAKADGQALRGTKGHERGFAMEAHAWCPRWLRLALVLESGGDGGVGQVYVAAHVPAELFAWAQAELGHGEKRRNEACVLDVFFRAIVVEEPVAVEELEHDVGGYCRRLRDGAAQEGSAEALAEGSPLPSPRISRRRPPEGGTGP